MDDIAKLGVEIDARSVPKANKSLDGFQQRATKAERANDKLTGSQRKGRIVTDRYAKSVGGMSGALGHARRAMLGLATAASAFTAIKLGFGFKDALAEVSTLVDETTFNMKELEIAALRQNAAFGGGATGQAKAFYQIISAGATSAAEANDILTASNKLAIGGVTNTATAAGGLVGILNAYGDAAGTATSVSDALFVAMRNGQTTIGALAGGIGKVSPLAAQLGVDFDTLAATVSALTTVNNNTQESITGVRAILAGIAKPTAEATKLANKLGIEFNSAGLKAKGFQGFIEDLVSKTGGSTDALAQLFGGVEALVPIMSLAGAAGTQLNINLEDMAGKAGATEEAFNKMAASPGFQTKRLWGAISSAVLRVASVIADRAVPAITSLADKFSSPAFSEFVAVVGTALVVAMNAASAAISFVSANSRILFDIFKALVLAKTISFVASLTAAFISFAQILRNVGILSALFNASMKTKVLLFSALAVVVARGLGVLDEFSKSLSNIFETAKGLLPESFAAGIDDAYDSFNNFNLGSKGIADNLVKLQTNANGLADSFGSLPSAAAAADAAVAALGDTTKAATAKVKDGVSVAREAVGGFINEFKSGLQQGKGIWASFADAAISALDRISSRLLDSALDGLFGGGGIGNVFGSLLGGGGAGSVASGASGLMMSPFYHKGGTAGAPGGEKRAVSSSVFNGAPRYHGGGVVGLKPNEVPAILERGETIIPNNAIGSGTGGQNMHITLGVSVDEEGSIKAFVERVSANVSVAVVQQATPGIVNQSVQGSGAALGGGGHDKAMQRYGARPRAIVR